MIRINNIALLFFIACVGGLFFVFTCKQIYESKLSELKKKAKNAFVEAVGQEFQIRGLKGPLLFYSDSICWEGATEKHLINNNINSIYNNYIFGETFLLPDSLNAIWKENLLKSHILTKSALCISVKGESGNVESQYSVQSEWSNQSNLMFTICIYYDCEIKYKGYLHYSIWNMIYKEFLFFLLLYIFCVFSINNVCKLVIREINAIREKKLKPIIKVVKEINDTPIRSYILHNNIIFYAEQKKIEFNGVEKKLQKQASQLLELFLLKKEDGYVLKDSEIKESLWPDGSGGSDRIYKAIARLRSSIREFDNSIDIKRGIGNYQLLL